MKGKGPPKYQSSEEEHHSKQVGGQCTLIFLPNEELPKRKIIDVFLRFGKRYRIEARLY